MDTCEGFTIEDSTVSVPWGITEAEFGAVSQFRMPFVALHPSFYTIFVQSFME
jgi:hypothetical protein